MKKLYFYSLLLLIFINHSVLAQNTGYVQYQDIQSLGAPGADLLSYKAALFFDEGQSLYITKVDSLENGGKSIVKTYEKEDGSIQGIRSSSIPTGIFNYTNRDDKVMVSNPRFKYGYTHKEPVPNIQWEIKKESKTMEGLEVIKAEAIFRGRKYIAWFTPDIPVSLGPWKLNGLPGLILEAYDETREIQFVFQKLIYPYDQKPQFPQFKKDIPGFEDMIAQQKDNFEKNIRMQRAMAQKFEGSSNEGADEAEKRKRYLEIFDY